MVVEAHLGQGPALSRLRCSLGGPSEGHVDHYFTPMWLSSSAQRNRETAMDAWTLCSALPDRIRQTWSYYCNARCDYGIQEHLEMRVRRSSSTGQADTELLLALHLDPQMRWGSANFPCRDYTDGAFLRYRMDADCQSHKVSSGTNS